MEKDSSIHKSYIYLSEFYDTIILPIKTRVDRGTKLIKDLNKQQLTEYDSLRERLDGLMNLYQNLVRILTEQEGLAGAVIDYKNGLIEKEELFNLIHKYNYIIKEK